MGENKKKSGVRRFLSGVLALVMALLLIALIYAAGVLLHSPEIRNEGGTAQETPVPVTPLQPGSSADAAHLQSLFGVPVPMLPGYPVQGSVQNAVHDGETARTLILDYQGFTVSAVQPASAAPLLLRDQLSVSLRSDLILFNRPAVLAHRDGQYCLYFSDDRAAYSVYAPQATEESFLELLERLTLDSGI